MSSPRRSLRLGLSVLALALLPALPPAAAGEEPVALREPGFRARVFEECAAGAGASPLEITHAICAPIPDVAFGQHVIYAVRNPGDDSAGRVERISLDGRVEVFLSGIGSPSDLVISSPSANRRPSELNVRSQCGADPSLQSTSVFAEGGVFRRCLDPGPPLDGHSDWDLHGDAGFGFDWFLNTGTEILRTGERPANAVSFSASSGPGEILFGPGGAWGEDLYVAGGGIVEAFGASGTLGSFPHVFSEWDWVQGPGFDGDMFDLCGAGTICRVRPDGTATVFATRVTGRHLVGCAGQLWIMEAGNCVQITRGRGSFRAPRRAVDRSPDGQRILPQRRE